MKVLILESDKNSAMLELEHLQANGIHCDFIDDGEAGLDQALSVDYDLVLLDITLPRRDGFSVCNALRLEKNIPIIFLTDRTYDADKVRAFALGADDYITKPFSSAELLARVKAHINRYHTLVHESGDKLGVLTIRDLRIDRDSHQVFLKNKEISMPIREFKLLLFLAQNPNIVFSKERLFDRLWGMDAMGDVATVTVHIQRIRDKLEKIAKDDKYIETIWGAGYRFRG